MTFKIAPCQRPELYTILPPDPSLIIKRALSVKKNSPAVERATSQLKRFFQQITKCLLTLRLVGLASGR